MVVIKNEIIASEQAVGKKKKKHPTEKMMKGFSSYMFLWGRLQVIDFTIGRLNFDEESLEYPRTCWQFVDVFVGGFSLGRKSCKAQN